MISFQCLQGTEGVARAKGGSAPSPCSGKGSRRCWARVLWARKGCSLSPNGCTLSWWFCIFCLVWRCLERHPRHRHRRTWCPFHHNVFFMSWRARLHRGRTSQCSCPSCPGMKFSFLSPPAVFIWRTAGSICSTHLQVLSAFLETSFPDLSVVISVHQATNN